jgi:hypothetical protein
MNTIRKASYTRGFEKKQKNDLISLCKKDGNRMQALKIVKTYGLNRSLRVLGNMICCRAYWFKTVFSSELYWQKSLIEEEKWDHLIVLDGCSYDYFRDLNYFEGKLLCAVSPATGTGPWAERTWTRPYDAVYISGNPHINSSGYTFRWKLMKRRLFDPKNFIKIINAWSESEEVGTPPNIVTRCAIKNLHKQMIIHYMQPHLPFIGEVKIPVAGVGNTLNWLRENDLGMDYYQAGYEANIKTILKATEKILSHLDGNIVITSDHGYWDGSKGKVGHEGYSPYLQRVPWFEVAN